MKRFLLTFLFIGLILITSASHIVPVFAADPTPTVDTSTPAPVNTTTPTPPDAQSLNSGPVDGNWEQDADVTFAGKLAARSSLLLNWTLKNYQWSIVQGNTNPLGEYWKQVRDIIFVLLSAFVLITAFLLILTRGRSVTITRFIPRFVGVILLIVFSFTIVSFLYQITDIFQLFFIRRGDTTIQASNLLNIAFSYQEFVGFRLHGMIYDESAFMSLLLVKLTALTYFVMVGILLIRKVILWFFLIISPVLPLLLLYAPVRNTAKIWIGEFFRWLLYAPLFAIFLAGLVKFWEIGIPIYLDNVAISAASKADPTAANLRTFTTSINILLGGPQQNVSIYNSLNLTDTFALYIVSLMMLWVVILLPFVLLRIFLTYFNSFVANDPSTFKQMLAGYNIFNKPPGTPPPTTPKAPPAGFGRNIPFINRFSIPEVKPQPPTNTGMARSIPVSSPVMRNASVDVSHIANVSIPSLRDIAKYETGMQSRNISRHQEVAAVHETLEKIANPTQVSNAFERDKYSSVRNQLLSEQGRGNPVAAGILSASTVLRSTTNQTPQVKQVLEHIANPTSAGPEQRQQYITLHNTITEAQKQGNPLAQTVLSSDSSQAVEKVQEAGKNGDPLAKNILSMAQPSSVDLPAANRVQSVSIDDYEAVKKLWQENYQKQDVPPQFGEDRSSWLQKDMDKITQTINLLSSSDPRQKQEGMSMVGNILPFLLIGGFSQTEVVAYLKAKLEAGKSVMGDIGKQKEEEDTKVSVERKTEEAQKTMTAEALVDPLDASVVPEGTKQTNE